MNSRKYNNYHTVIWNPSSSSSTSHIDSIHFFVLKSLIDSSLDTLAVHNHKSKVLLFKILNHLCFFPNSPPPSNFSAHIPFIVQCPSELPIPYHYRVTTHAHILTHPLSLTPISHHNYIGPDIPRVLISLYLNLNSCIVIGCHSDISIKEATEEKKHFYM